MSQTTLSCQSNLNQLTNLSASILSDTPTDVLEFASPPPPVSGGETQVNQGVGRVLGRATSSDYVSRMNRLLGSFRNPVLDRPSRADSSRTPEHEAFTEVATIFREHPETNIATRSTHFDSSRTDEQLHNALRNRVNENLSQANPSADEVLNAVVPLRSGFNDLFLSIQRFRIDHPEIELNNLDLRNQADQLRLYMGDRVVMEIVNNQLAEPIRLLETSTELGNINVTPLTQILTRFGVYDPSFNQVLENFFRIYETGSREIIEIVHPIFVWIANEFLPAFSALQGGIEVSWMTTTGSVAGVIFILLSFIRSVRPAVVNFLTSRSLTLDSISTLSDQTRRAIPQAILNIRSLVRSAPNSGARFSRNFSSILRGLFRWAGRFTVLGGGGILATTAYFFFNQQGNSRGRIESHTVVTIVQPEPRRGSDFLPTGAELGLRARELMSNFLDEVAEFFRVLISGRQNR